MRARLRSSSNSLQVLVLQILLSAAVAVAIGVSGPAASVSAAPQPKDEREGQPRKTDWAKVVSPATLEKEVRSIHLALDEKLTNFPEFRRSYREVRQHFNELAALFAVIDQYGGDTRWQASAALAAQQFARVASACKVVNRQAFNEASKGKQALGKLLDGELLAGEAPRQPFHRLVDRAPLMKRLEQAYKAMETDDAGKFEAQQQQAAFVVLAGNVLGQAGMPEADDDDYRQHLARLTGSAQRVYDASKASDRAASGKAFAALRQACSGCHADYR